MKNLQEKFDQIPIAFDKEALWDRIEKPKKQDRKILWFPTVVLCLSICFGSFYLFDFDAHSIGNNKVVTNKITSKNEQPKIEDSKRTMDNSKQKNIQSLNSRNNLEKNTIHPSKDQHPSRSKIGDQRPNSKEEKSINFEGPKTAPNFEETNQIKLAKENVYNLGFVNQNSIKRNLNFSNSIFEEKVVSKKGSDFTLDDKEQQIAGKATVIDQIESLPLFGLKLIERSQIDISESIETENDFIKPLKENHKRSIIGFAFGIGTHKNKFTGAMPNVEIRNSIETNIEDYALAVYYEKMIFGKYYLNSSLQLNIIQNKINANTIEEVLNFQNRMLNLEQIFYQYNFYNEYYTFNMSLGLGRKFYFQKWEMGISIGAGMQLYQRVNGHLFDEQLNIIHLDKDEYLNTKSGLFGMAEWSVSRNISSYQIGLSLNINTSQQLISHNATNHRVHSKYLTLRIGKKF